MNEDYQSLLEFYNQYIPAKQAYVSHAQAYNQCQIQLRALEEKRKSYSGEGIISMIFTVIFGIAFLISGLEDSDGMLAFTFFSGIALFMLSVYLLARSSSTSDWYKSSMNNIIRNMQESQSKAMDYIIQTYESTNKFVPQKYSNPYTVEKFIEYFNNGRVDTLKEAINLYEQEQIILQQQQQMNQLVAYNQIAAANSQLTAAATSYLAVDQMLKNIR